MVAYAATLAALLALPLAPVAAFVPAGPGGGARAPRAPAFADPTEGTAPPAPPAPAPVAPAPPAPASRVRGLALAPVDAAAVQFAAGSLGAVLGLAVGGPVLAALLAAVGNYLARKDGDAASVAAPAGQVVGQASSTALSAYNSLAAFEQERKLIDAVLALLEEKAQGEAFDAVKGALGSATKVVEENDLVGGAGTALNGAGDLLETGLDKLVALAQDKSFE